VSLNDDLLYSWLPAHVRIRDRAQGEPLRALMAVASQVVNQLHEDIGALYRNWFIETASPWVVPYIGDLVGTPRLRAMSPRSYTLRAYVANAVALRRRKGTPAALEQVAQDVTGWHASVLEMFQIVSATQHIKHPRPAALRTPPLRSADEMDRLYGPFERAAHSLDVRNLDRALDPIAVLTERDRGRYNLSTVSLFVWRLRAWPVTLAPAIQHSSAAGHSFFHFNQLGRDMALFNFPQTKLEPASLAQEHHLPGPLRQAALYLELEARRQAEVDGVTPVPAWFGSQPPFRIYRQSAGGEPVELSASELLIGSLAGPETPGWQAPPNRRRYFKATGGFEDKPIVAVVDPERGRFLFTAGNEPLPGERVLVSYYYGFSSDLGGGTYDRHAELSDVAGMSVYPVRYDAGGENALANALQEWLADQPNTAGAVLEIQDNFIYRLSAGLSVAVPAGKRLELRAANRKRPVIVLGGDWNVTLASHAGLTLDGLWVQGGRIVVTVDTAGPTTLRVSHSTLVPATGARSLRIQPPAAATAPPLAFSCSLHRSITGALDLSELAPDCELDLEDSIIDNGSGTAIEHGGSLNARASTILGATRTRSLALGSDMLFTGFVMSVRRQSGSVRFSYAPPDSELPPRFHCQPEIPSDATDTERAAILYREQPRFTSVEYGQPGYCQLAVSMPDEVLRGASDEGELGAFNHLEQSQRTLNLRDALDEFLRLGLEAGLIFAS
jgi:hypothetical protein